MTAWTGTAYRYFSIDSADDLTDTPLALGLTRGVYPVAAEHVTGMPGVAARLGTIQPAPAPGTTRFWWRALVGMGTQLPVDYGTNTIHGQLTDNPEVLPSAWRIQIAWDN